MSLRAMLWALHEADAPDPIDRLILLAYADYAHDDGTCAWPSVGSIAETVNVDRVTVHRHLKDLQGRGLLVRGDQQYVAHVRADRRPVVYDLPISRGGALQPRGSARGVAQPPHGVTHGVSPAPHDPKNQEITQGARRPQTVDGPVDGDALGGCAAHATRRPACPDCTRVLPIRRDKVRPASPDAAKAARRALRG
jgi:hypothetical protein